MRRKETHRPLLRRAEGVMGSKVQPILRNYWVSEINLNCDPYVTNELPTALIRARISDDEVSTRKRCSGISVKRSA